MGEPAKHRRAVIIFVDEVNATVVYRDESGGKITAATFGAIPTDYEPKSGDILTYSIDEDGKPHFSQPGALEDLLSRHAKDAQYFTQKKKEFLEKYSGKFVAIRDQVVLASADSLKALDGILKQHVGTSDRVFINHVAEESFEEKPELIWID